MKYTMSVLVENHPGTLSKVSGLFSRRGFNIDSLAVGVTEDPAISRMTIATVSDDETFEQTVEELRKLGIECEPIRVDDYTGKKMTFFHDPDGLPLELHE